MLELRYNLPLNLFITLVFIAYKCSHLQIRCLKTVSYMRQYDSLTSFVLSKVSKNLSKREPGDLQTKRRSPGNRPFITEIILHLDGQIRISLK